MHTFARSIAVLALIGALFSVGCSSKPYVAHAYPGAQLPPAQVALIVVDANVRLMSVDGKRVDALPVDMALSTDTFAARQLYLLPGTHRIVGGIAARLYRGGSTFGGVGIGGGSGIGVGVGIGSGGGGRLVQGSTFDDEIEFDVEAGKNYRLFHTEQAGTNEQKSRLVLRDHKGGRKAPELQRFIARTPFDDPYAARQPTTQP